MIDITKDEFWSNAYEEVNRKRREAELKEDFVICRMMGG